LAVVVAAAAEEEEERCFVELTVEYEECVAGSEPTLALTFEYLELVDDNFLKI
jgi:hypothetical protein